VSDVWDNKATSWHASFAHDSIHQAAYHLIPQDQREAWHLKIGQTLWHETTGEEFDTFLFVILEQIFLGEAQIAEMEDRIAVASLCLHAGETAVKTSGFELSATYLEKGIGLLGPSKWRKNNTYDLCLGLFNNAIDTCYATGQMDRVESLIQEVLENARVFEDELRARVMLIYTLGTKQEMSAAIERGVETLKRLGEHMEKAPSKLNVRLTLAKARHLLRRNSDAHLMRLVAMTDQRLISVQIVLNVMWLSAYYNNAVLAAMISCRMVELSIQHGASVVSCVGFAMFATMVLG
jgi:predicted ATPase